jgi:hypothetical protein
MRLRHLGKAGVALGLDGGPGLAVPSMRLPKATPVRFRPKSKARKV